MGLLKDKRIIASPDRLVSKEGQPVTFSIYRNGAFNKELLDRLGQVSADATRTPDSPANHDEDILGQFADRANKFDFIVAVKEGERVVGYGGYRELRVREGRRLVRSHVLYESAKMMEPSRQKRGYGKKVSEIALKHANPEYIAVRTQNPYEASSLQSALRGVELAPVNTGFDKNPLLERMLLRVAQALGAADRLERVKGLDGKEHYTGVLKGMYGSKFGEHPADPTLQRRSSGIERRFRNLHVDQTAGDAVLILGKIK